jgi:hypothetical protein
MVVSAREVGGTTVWQENVDEVRRSRGVLLPFSQPQFLFRFIPSLLGCFCIQKSMLIILSGRIRLLRLSACVLERQTHRSICHFGRRDEDWWRRERKQECSVGRPEERRRGWRKVKIICLSCTTQPSNISVFLYLSALCSVLSFVALELNCHCRPLVVYSHERRLVLAVNGLDASRNIGNEHRE